MGTSTTRRLPHYLLGSTTRNLVRVLGRYGGCRGNRVGQALKLLAFSGLTSPFRCYESLRYRAKLRSVDLDPRPVFIIGHWQSGHSPLHMLMAQDSQFAYVNTLQAMFPWSFLCSQWVLRPMMKRAVRGKDRGSDSIALTVELPQGSDWPMATTSPYSAYHTYVFPQRAKEIFDRGILLNQLSEAQRKRWSQDYLLLMTKTAFAARRNLVLFRNASDTGRIPELLALFPQARFIHIVRNPYAVIRATMERWESMCRIWSLQSVDLEKLQSLSLEFYEALMHKYLGDRTKIPEHQLVEVRYEDLASAPETTLQSIYHRLSLGEPPTLSPEVRATLDPSSGGLAGGQWILNQPQINTIRERLQFSFEAFEYDANDFPPTASLGPSAN